MLFSNVCTEWWVNRLSGNKSSRLEPSWLELHLPWTASAFQLLPISSKKTELKNSWRKKEYFSSFKFSVVMANFHLKRHFRDEENIAGIAKLPYLKSELLKMSFVGRKEGWGRGCWCCWGCWGCQGCRGCWGCWGCWGCQGCQGCRGCWGCRGCRGQEDKSGRSGRFCLVWFGLSPTLPVSQSVTKVGIELLVQPKKGPTTQLTNSVSLIKKMLFLNVVYPELGIDQIRV